MAKTKKDKGVIKRITSLAADLRGLNDVSKKLVDDATNSDTTTRDENLSSYMDEINDIVSTDMKRLTNSSSKDLSLFFMEFLKEHGTDNSDKFKTIEDVFEADSSGVLNQMREEYSSDIAKMETIRDVVSQFAELREAVEVFRDTLINADEHTNNISRELLFKNVANVSDQSNIVSQIEALEAEYKLPQKIKSHIIPRVLEYGKYYVYVVPYSEIFEKYAVRKKNKQDGSTGDIALESANMDFINDLLGSDNKVSTVDKKNAVSAVNEVFSTISISGDDDLPIPVMENMDEVGMLYEKASKSKPKNTNVSVASDGVADIGSGRLDTDFSNVNGVYMRLIDPRKMIPVKVLDQVLGYYMIHDEMAVVNKSTFTAKFHIDLTKNYGRKEEDFINAISNRVVKSFNKSFLEKNVEFKENIASALIHSDVYNRKLKFQFIPAEHVVEFKINEDENGNGVGILDKSIFYGKLYTNLLTFNMLTILSKSNDQRVYYIHSSGIEKNIANKIQDAARKIKSREMNYSDLFNQKSMVSKVGPGRDAYIPVGTSGNQGITFDILAGQQVELHSDLMNMLKTSAINNSGVPAVVLDYINQADYSRSIVMGNLRFLSRCISTQLELGPQITELYKRIMIASGKFEDDVIHGFMYKLSKPRTLDMTNIADLINNSSALANFIVETLAGENGNKEEIDNITKDIALKQYLKDITASLGWDKFEEIWEDSILEAKKRMELESKDEL